MTFPEIVFLSIGLLIIAGATAFGGDLDED